MATHVLKAFSPRLKKLADDFHEKVLDRWLQSETYSPARRKRLWQLLLATDPTGKGLYVQPLVRWYVAGEFSLEEARKTRDMLADYHRRRPKLPVHMRDLNAFPSLKRFSEVLERAWTLVEGRKEVLRLTPLGDVDLLDAEVIFDDAGSRLYVVKTAKGLLHLGVGTDWANSTERHFDSLSGASPLYVIEDAGQRFLVHDATSRFCDELGHRVSRHHLDEMRGALEALIKRTLIDRGLGQVSGAVQLTNKMDMIGIVLDLLAFDQHRVFALDDERWIYVVDGQVAGWAVLREAFAYTLMEICPGGFSSTIRKSVAAISTTEELINLPSGSRQIAQAVLDTRELSVDLFCTYYARLKEEALGRWFDRRPGDWSLASARRAAALLEQASKSAAAVSSEAACILISVLAPDIGSVYQLAASREGLSLDIDNPLRREMMGRMDTQMVGVFDNLWFDELTKVLVRRSGSVDPNFELLVALFSLPGTGHLIVSMSPERRDVDLIEYGIQQGRGGVLAAGAIDQNLARAAAATGEVGAWISHECVTAGFLEALEAVPRDDAWRDGMIKVVLDRLGPAGAKAWFHRPQNATETRLLKDDGFGLDISEIKLLVTEALEYPEFLEFVRECVEHASSNPTKIRSWEFGFVLGVASKFPDLAHRAVLLMRPGVWGSGGSILYNLEQLCKVVPSAIFGHEGEVQRFREDTRIGMIRKDPSILSAFHPDVMSTRVVSTIGEMAIGARLNQDAVAYETLKQAVEVSFATKTHWKSSGSDAWGPTVAQRVLENIGEPEELLTLLGAAMLIPETDFEIGALAALQAALGPRLPPLFNSRFTLKRQPLITRIALRLKQMAGAVGKPTASRSGR